MNYTKHLLLKAKSALLLVIITVLGITGCDKDANNDNLGTVAEWTVSGQALNKSFKSTVDNNLLYAETHQAPFQKLSIKFGVKPTTSALLKVVDYFKVPLAADEMIIGIRQTTTQGEFFYLSTGADNITISPTITKDVNTGAIINLQVNFTNVQVKRHDISFNPLDVTTASGYIGQN
jgi:hypothetical protein